MLRNISNYYVIISGILVNSLTISDLLSAATFYEVWCVKCMLEILEPYKYTVVHIIHERLGKCTNIWNAHFGSPLLMQQQVMAK
jgi:hypothetical protein